MGKKMLSSFHNHFKLAECFKMVCGQYTQYNYNIKSRESATNGPELDDSLYTSDSFLVRLKFNY